MVLWCVPVLALMSTITVSQRGASSSMEALFPRVSPTISPMISLSTCLQLYFPVCVLTSPVCVHTSHVSIFVSSCAACPLWLVLFLFNKSEQRHCVLFWWIEVLAGGGLCHWWLWPAQGSSSCPLRDLCDPHYWNPVVYLHYEWACSTLCG